MEDIPPKPRKGNSMQTKKCGNQIQLFYQDRAKVSFLIHKYGSVNLKYPSTVSKGYPETAKNLTSS